MKSQISYPDLVNISPQFDMDSSVLYNFSYSNKKKAIHYFNCNQIVDILRETEKDTKNIFGMYSSQRMKDWNSIAGMYQKNGLYLGEAASILQRNVAYEIPALKKQINKCQQQSTVCLTLIFYRIKLKRFITCKPKKSQKGMR
jgi:hypothetical protein